MGLLKGKNFYFLVRNDITGKYINVLGERYDIREIKKSDIAINYKVCPKTSYPNLKSFLKEMCLKEYYK